MATKKDELLAELKRQLNHEETKSILVTACGGNVEVAKRAGESIWKMLRLDQEGLTQKAEAHFKDFIKIVSRFAPLDLDYSVDLYVQATGQGAKSNFVAYYTADGLRKLYHRSPRIKTRAPVIVHENDKFEYKHVAGENGTEVKMEYSPELDGDPGAPRLGYIAYAVDNEWDVLLVRKAEFNAAQQSSRNQSTWERNPIPMWKKTLFRRLDKLVPLYDAINMKLPDDSDMEEETKDIKGEAKPVGEIHAAWSANDSGEAEAKAKKKPGRPKKKPKAEGSDGGKTSEGSSAPPPPEASEPEEEQQAPVQKDLSQYTFGEEE